MTPASRSGWRAPCATSGAAAAASSGSIRSPAATVSSRSRAGCSPRCRSSTCSRRRTTSKVWPRSNLISRGSEMGSTLGSNLGVLERAAQRQALGEAFVLATVVRTVSVTAAKAGAKALIAPDGHIEEGWIGGGCARAAVVKAAKQALADGQSRLVSIAPKEGLDALGVSPGEETNGVFFARNSCPSQGTMDIFIEPVLPQPKLLILGASPVAVALASQAPAFGFAVTVAAAPGELDRFAQGPAKFEGVSPPPNAGQGAYVVISTQGAGDRAALKAAAAM